MTATVTDGTERDGHYFYKVTLGTTNDTALASPQRGFNYANYPIIFHCKPGTNSILWAEYTQDPAASSGSFFRTSHGDITKDTAVVFDYYAIKYSIGANNGGSTDSVVWVESPTALNWETS